MQSYPPTQQAYPPQSQPGALHSYTPSQPYNQAQYPQAQPDMQSYRPQAQTDTQSYRPQPGFNQPGYPSQDMQSYRPGKGMDNAHGLHTLTNLQYQQPKEKQQQGGGLLNTFERWTGVDWNGDGTIGGAAPQRKQFDWQEYERIHGVDLDGDGKIGGRQMNANDAQGIGVVLQAGYRGEAFISEISEEGPAATEGTLRVGDRVTAVDGIDTEGEDINEVVNLIRGPKGTICHLVAKRGHMSMLVRVQRGMSTHPQKLYATFGQDSGNLPQSEWPVQPHYATQTNGRGPHAYALPGQPPSRYAQDGRLPPSQMRGGVPAQAPQPRPNYMRPQAPRPTHAQWGPPIPGSVPPGQQQVSYVWDHPRQAREYSGQPFPNGASIPPFPRGSYVT